MIFGAINMRSLRRYKWCMAVAILVEKHQTSLENQSEEDDSKRTNEQMERLRKLLNRTNDPN